MHSFSSNAVISNRNIYIAIDRGIVRSSEFKRKPARANFAILAAMSVSDLKDIISSLVILSSSEYAGRRVLVEAKYARRYYLNIYFRRINYSF